MFGVAVACGRRRRHSSHSESVSAAEPRLQTRSEPLVVSCAERTRSWATCERLNGRFYSSSSSSPLSAIKNLAAAVYYSPSLRLQIKSRPLLTLLDLVARLSLAAAAAAAIPLHAGAARLLL